MSEKMAIALIEFNWLVYSRRYNIYTVFEETPEYYEWTIGEVIECDRARKKGLPYQQLAYIFGRSHEEIAMLILDREVNSETMTRKSKKATYQLFQDYPDFLHWHLKDVLRFDQLYKDKVPLPKIAKIFERTQEEVALLTIDRALKDKIGG